MIKSTRNRRALILALLTISLLLGSTAYRGVPSVAAKAAPQACDVSISVGPLDPSTFLVNNGQLFIPPIQLLGEIQVTAATSDCWLQFGVDGDWVTIISAKLNENFPGDFTGTIIFRVEANTLPQRRIARFSIGDETFQIFQGGRFNDAPDNYLYFTEIGLMSAHGITNGCSPGLFCVEAPTSRSQMAAFVIRSIGEFDPPVPVGQTFVDVPPTNPFFPFVERLAALGITSGCSPGHYCPDQDIPRDQMAVFVIRAIGEFNPPFPASQRFADVPPSNQFYSFVDRLAALGITNGCQQSPALLYCPDDPITRGETAKFLTRAFHF